MDEHLDHSNASRPSSRLATLREKYLFAFRNAMLFGRCAGTVTELPLLHRATLTLDRKELDSWASTVKLKKEEITKKGNDIAHLHVQLRDNTARLESEEEVGSAKRLLEHRKHMQENIMKMELDFDVAVQNYEHWMQNHEPSVDSNAEEYATLKREIRKANDHLRTQFERDKRSRGWDPIDDKPWLRTNLTHYLIKIEDEEFREQSLALMFVQQKLSELSFMLKDNESRIGTVPKNEYFNRMRQISKEMAAFKEQKEELERLCDYLSIRDEFRSDIFPIAYGRPWKQQKQPENYKELIETMETCTQNDETHLLRIFGDPGQGKSTLLQQLAYDFSTNQLVHQRDHMPFFFKAKHIARLKTGTLSTPEGTEHLDNEPFLDDFKTGEIVDALFESDSDLKDYITKEELVELIHLEGEEAHTKPRCIFIDAFDECSSASDRDYVREFIHNEVTDFHSNIIVTCRTTHKESLEMKTNTVKTCHLHYSEEELRRDMPQKLSDAWGIKREVLTIPTEIYFDNYQSVLSHPLYVGWFCFLLRNDKLQITEQPDFNILQGNTVLNELHIAFLKQVIEVGIEISIAEKYPTRTDAFDQEKILNLFCLIAANYFTMNTQNLDVILTRINRVHSEIKITPIEEEFIRSNMGLLFVNDEHALEFTHETLPEVALGIIFEDSRYADEYLPKSAEESGLMHRRDLINSSAWSQCIVLTRAVLRKNRGEGTLKSCIIDLLPSVPGPFVEQTIGMLTVNEGPIISIQNDGLYPYMNQEKVDPSQDEIILYEVGQKYLESIENSERFPLEFPARFKNQADSRHPVDVIYQHTTIFDCSDLLITTDLLGLLQRVSPTSASRILELWSDEGEIDSPILLQWYLGHVQHGSINSEFEANFLDRLTWDGQRKIQSISLNNAASRLISGLEYSLSLSVNSHERGGLADRFFPSVDTTSLHFLDHILSPVQQNQDIDLVFLIERYGEKLRYSLLKISELLSKTICESMIGKPPVRQDKQMSNNSIQRHIARILEIPSVSNALLQYFAAVLWHHCKHPEISLIQRGNLHRQDREELERFWSLFEQDLSKKKAQMWPHPINMIYSNSKKVPEVLLNLMDILLPYIGTDARSKGFEGREVIIDHFNVGKMGRNRMKQFAFKTSLEKMFKKSSTISGTHQREEND